MKKNLYLYEKTLTLQNFSQNNIQMVPWMSGLVSGLQNHLGRFDSARYLKTPSGQRPAFCFYFSILQVFFRTVSI